MERVMRQWSAAQQISQKPRGNREDKLYHILLVLLLFTAAFTFVCCLIIVYSALNPPTSPTTTQLGDFPAPAAVSSVEDSKVIMLDPGHGGKSSGALYDGIAEKDINLAVSEEVKSNLENAGYRVIMTRDSDVYLDLYERSDLANTNNVDLFVSIHSNALKDNTEFQGIITYHYPGSTRGQQLAEHLQSSLVAFTGAENQGILSENFVVLRETSMCAALVEMGFMSTPEELKLLVDQNYQSKLASGIAEGIRTYLES